jgi:glutathione peroxidase
MKLSILSFFLVLTITGFAQKSIYDYKVNAITGDQIDFNDLRGKLIVVVNIASGSERQEQLLQLDTLCRTYASSGLVVVAFPTNDFNKEPKSNEQIRTWVSGLHPNLKVANITSVKGGTIADFYQWCTLKEENGRMDMPVSGDYQKFIISKDGKLLGAFSGVLSPLAKPFTKAIEANL